MLIRLNGTIQPRTYSDRKMNSNYHMGSSSETRSQFNRSKLSLTLVHVKIYAISNCCIGMENAVYLP